MRKNLLFSVRLKSFATVSPTTKMCGWYKLSAGIMHADINSILDAIKKEIVKVIGNCKSWSPPLTTAGIAHASFLVLYCFHDQSNMLAKTCISTRNPRCDTHFSCTFVDCCPQNWNLFQGLGACPPSCCPLTAVSRPHQTPFYPQLQSVTPSYTQLSSKSSTQISKCNKAGYFACQDIWKDIKRIWQWGKSWCRSTK